jgi:branched-chain amino acid transport system permease protein
LRSAIIAVVVLVPLVSWANAKSSNIDIFLYGAMYALIALGMYVPFVLGGSLGLAYGAYAAVGAYAVGLTANKTDLPVVFGWAFGAVVAAAIAVVLGMATRRLSGFYLAAVTLLFATAFETWLVTTDWVGGSLGQGGIRDVSLLGWIPSRYQWVFVSAVLIVVIAFFLDRLRMSPWGVVVRGMRDVPLAVESAGARVPTLNLVALAIGGGIASLGGSLFASTVHGVTPQTFTLEIVFLALFMPLIGGVGTSWGAVLGAAIVAELTLNFDAFEASGKLILAIGVIVILMVAPRGVAGYLDAFRKRLLPGTSAHRG